MGRSGLRNGCNYGALLALTLLGFACGHLPPSYRIESEFKVPASIQKTRAACPGALADFIRQRSGAKALLRKTGELDVISCSVVSGESVQCHWNIVLHRADERETSMTITRFVLRRNGYIPLSSGEEEADFAAYITQRLGGVHD